MSFEICVGTDLPEKISLEQMSKGKWYLNCQTAYYRDGDDVLIVLTDNCISRHEYLDWPQDVRVSLLRPDQYILIRNI